MKKTFLWFLWLLLVTFLTVPFSPVYSQYGTGTYNPQNVKHIKGEVVSVALVGSSITIKFVQANGNNDERTFKVTMHTRITKGDYRISLSQLSSGDEVAVEYYEDPMSFDDPSAQIINVKSSQ